MDDRTRDENTEPQGEGRRRRRMRRSETEGASAPVSQAREGGAGQSEAPVEPTATYSEPYYADAQAEEAPVRSARRRASVNESKPPVQDSDLHAQWEAFDEAFAQPQERQPRRGHGCLIAALIIVVILCAAAAAGWFLFPTQRDQLVSTVLSTIGINGAQSDPITSSVLAFSCEEIEMAEAEAKVTFRIVTNLDTSRVALRDNSGETLVSAPGEEAEFSVVQAAEGLVWTLCHTFTTPYTGAISAVAGTDAGFAETGVLSTTLDLPMAIATPEPMPTQDALIFATAQPTVEPTPQPTVEPTPEPTAVPTAQPTAKPTATPTPVPTPVPTPTPTIVPTPTPTPVPTPTPTPVPTPTPSPTPVPYVLYDAQGSVESDPELLTLKSEVLSGGETVESVRQDVSVGDPDEYNYQPGVLTFRGGPQRQNAAYGTVEVENGTLEVAWAINTQTLTGKSETFSGIGWTGQPLLVKWHKQIREMMNIKEEKREKSGLIEVIYPSMDGNIYFLDLEDGKHTRDPIEVGYPLAGTAAVDPRGYPILYAGQSESVLKSTTGTIGMRIFNLIDQTQMHLETGKNLFSLRTNGAVITSPVLAKEADTLVYTASNGLLYTLKLNTQFGFVQSMDAEDTTLSVDPETTAYRYTAKVSGDNLGIEGSVAVYGHYAYFADYLGLLQCVDLDTMQCVWVVQTEDNTDATIALEDEGDGKIALYTANTVQRRKQKKSSDVYIRRYDALSGRLEWEYAITCKYNKDNLGGAMASPIVGKGNISDLVIFTINQTDDGADMLALEKSTGEVIWDFPLDVTAVSSPVAVYAQDGTSYILQGDDSGLLRLLDGFNGYQLSTTMLGNQIIGSPAVYDNMAVVGTDGTRIYGVRIQ